MYIAIIVGYNYTNHTVSNVWVSQTPFVDSISSRFHAPKSVFQFIKNVVNKHVSRQLNMTSTDYWFRHLHIHIHGYKISI